MTAPLGPAWFLGDPAVDHPADLVRLLVSSLLMPASGGNGVEVQNGLLPNVSNGRGTLTLLSTTSLRVDPFFAVVQSTRSAVGGAYLVPNTVQRTLALPARDGSQYRRSLVVVEVLDAAAMNVAGDASNNFARLRVIQGSLSASASPTLPGTPDDAFSLGEVLTPPTSASGASVTVTPYDRPTTLRGGTIVVEEEHTASQWVRHRGQLRDHPSKGLQRVSAAGEYETIAPRQSHLGSDSGVDGSATVDEAIINMTITVPEDLPPGRRIRYSGDVYVVTPAGVTPKVSFHGGRGARTISRSAAFSADVHVEYYDNDLTPGSRNVQLRVDAVGGEMDYYDPRLHATIV